jgi:metalloprotease
MTAAALSGCETEKLRSSPMLGEIGGNAMKTLSLTDGDVIKMSDESCAAMDAKSQVASASNKYAVRLNQVTKTMPSTVNGKVAAYKVYLTKNVNAWAMANGCIRVYSGLMDLMNDDELRGVIGHEIGHVALGHSKASMQTAYGVSAARSLAAASGNSTLTALSQSQAGDLAEKFINAQFSQTQESAADNYSFDLLTSAKLERKGLVTSFQKLAKLTGDTGGSSILSSHPPSTERAANMQRRLDGTK